MHRNHAVELRSGSVGGHQEMSRPILWIYTAVPLLFVRQFCRPSRQFCSTNPHQSRHGQELLKNGSLRSYKKKNKLRGFVHGIARNACYIDGWWNSPWLKSKVTSLRRQTKSSRFLPGESLQENVNYVNSGRKLVRRAPTPVSPAEVLSRLCTEGKLSDACEAIDFMDQQGMEAPIDILSRLLQECTKEKNIMVGRQVHGLICRSGLEVNVFMTYHLIRMYDVCESLVECNQVFGKHPAPDRAAWAAIISAHDSRAHPEEVVKLYHSMLQSGVKADFSVYLAVLKACGSTSALATGKLVHSQVMQGGQDLNMLIANALIIMYVKCGSMEDAQVVFTGLNAKSLVSWNAMITGYAQRGDGKHALKLFNEMQTEGMQPDAYTLVSALHASSCDACLDQGRMIHARIEGSAYNSDVFVNNALIGMYLKCGSLNDARNVFHELHVRDVVSWNTMIAGYSQIGDGQQAIALYVQMSHEGFQPDKVTFISILKACGSMLALDQGKLAHARIVSQGLETDRIIGGSLIDMYSRCGHIEESRRLFESLPSRDVVTWNALITGYSHQGNGQEALELFSRMKQEGMRPDNITLVTVLKACSSATALDQRKLKELLGQVVASGLASDVFVGTMLVGLYAKCGNLVDARRVFEKVRQRNVVSWNAMILGYAQMQVGGMALQLYAKMQAEGIAPDERTFAAGLKACGCVAALEKGKEIHAQVSESGLDMTDSFIATALIDMYSKCGSMEDAHRVFDALNTRDTVSWNTLIAGYAQQGESGLVFDLFHRMSSQGIKPDRLTFLNLLTACSHAGLISEAHKYFEMMTTTDHRVAPTIEHYCCMVDVLGRAGQVEMAMETAKTMPFQPCVDVWRSLLGACRKWRNVDLGRHAFDCAIRLDVIDALSYALMSNIYAAAHMTEDAKQVLQAMREKYGAWKKAERTWWTDLSGTVHAFGMTGNAHWECQAIHAKLQDLSGKGVVEERLSDTATEDAICAHSEKLAVAFALLKTPRGSTIRVVKNKRMCEDCHIAIAHFSKMEQRTIICRDATRFHVYRDGKCSCQDYW